jgi:stearoyl-CoA desaturase (Delta-9 desaturase)
MSQAQATPIAPATEAPGVDDVQPVSHELVDRIATGTITVVPFIALGIVGWQVWNDLLHWSDVAVFLIMYLVTGLGVTVGFHRHLTHRAFKAKPWVHGGLAIMGSMAIEGPVTAWVADHRKHHAFADKEGDPHSPHVGHEGGVRGALTGLFHAHVGWLFIHTHRGAKACYAPDLQKDPLIRWVDKTFLLWVVVGLVLAFALGYAIGGTLTAALTGLLWGGGVRMLVVHHVTYSINSLCHFFGEKRYPTDDHSRNLLWLAVPTLGESWHNNHHAFPTSAAHGLRKRDIDPSAAVIRVMERLGLVWDVVRISPERQAQKAAG